MTSAFKRWLLLAALLPAVALAQTHPAASAAEPEPGAPVPLRLSAMAERVPPGTVITLKGSGPVLADAPPKAIVTGPDNRPGRCDGDRELRRAASS